MPSSPVCRRSGSRCTCAAATGRPMKLRVGGGDYRSLPATLGAPDVGVLMLELCTPRAGEIEVLSALPDHLRVGVGAVNQKHSRIENFAEIVARGEQGDCPFWRGASPADPDCGLATFADNPVASVSIAEQKLRAIAHAADLLRSSYIRCEASSGMLPPTRTSRRSEARLSTGLRTANSRQRSPGWRLVFRVRGGQRRYLCTACGLAQFGRPPHSRPPPRR